jgi:hypothetical protein
METCAWCDGTDISQTGMTGCVCDKEGAPMYWRKEGWLYVLRQERYRAQLEQGNEHPHDTCAYARNADERTRMEDCFTGAPFPVEGETTEQGG